MLSRGSVQVLARKHMYRFSFDLGAGSLGWAVFKLDDSRRPTELGDLGVRIFPTGRDPKSKETNSAGRRQPRQQRRQIDRRKSRRQHLEELLVAAGLMPARDDQAARTVFFAIDPYLARARAAGEKCSLHELGRAIWHISKHRGFKSNRKANRSNESDNGKIATARRCTTRTVGTEGRTHLRCLACKAAYGRAAGANTPWERQRV